MTTKFAEGWIGSTARRTGSYSERGPRLLLVRRVGLRPTAHRGGELVMRGCGRVEGVEGQWWGTWECSGSVTGDDQKLAAPPGTTMSMPRPCRHRHELVSIIPETKREN